jgi:hypothetical protein
VATLQVILPAKALPSEEAEGDESRVVAAACNAAAECAGKSPPLAPQGARDGR